MPLMMQVRPDSNPGAFGLRWNDANGLTVPINSGAVLNGTVWTLVPRASIQLANNDTTYVEVTPAGLVQSQTGQFTSGLGYVSLYTIRVAAMIVTSITDWRWFGQTSINGNTAQVLTARKTLTDAQIKTLPTTGVTIIPAQGAGKVTVPLVAFGMLDNSAGAYTLNAGSSWLLMWESGSYVGSPRVVAQEMTNPDSYMLALPVLFQNEGTVYGVGMDGVVIGDNSSQSLSDAANKALQIKDDWNGVSNYTGGNAANTLTMIVLYTVVDTTLA